MVRFIPIFAWKPFFIYFTCIVHKEGHFHGIHPVTWNSFESHFDESRGHHVKDILVALHEKFLIWQRGDLYLTFLTTKKVLQKRKTRNLTIFRSFNHSIVFYLFYLVMKLAALVTLPDICSIWISCSLSVRIFTDTPWIGLFISSF